MKKEELINKINGNSNVIENPWIVLKKYTDARIAQGRSGISLPTSSLLRFQVDHAKAQDAVHLPLDVEYVFDEINKKSFNINITSSNISEKTVLKKGHETILLHSKIRDRFEYLQRPDLGRRLDEESHNLLKNTALAQNGSYDLAIIIVDGLSSLAIKENAINFIDKLCEALSKDEEKWRISPFIIVEQGRVAIGDEIGMLLKAKSTIVLIGERPGLSSPNSLGLYFTWNPRLNLTDESRNCISNIRLDGLSYEDAVKKAIYLLKESRKLKLSGVNLKDRVENNEVKEVYSKENFLLN